MRILMVTPYFYPRIGGLENYSFNVAGRLVRKGHHVKVLSNGPTPANYVVDGIPTIRLRHHFTLSNTPITLDLALHINRAVNEWKPDLINAHTPVVYSADVAAIISKKHQVPFILTYHNDNFKNSRALNLMVQFYNHTLNMATLSLSNKIIVASPFVYHESPFIKHFRRKAVWIPPGVDTSTYYPLNTPDTDKENRLTRIKSVLFVGQLSSAHAHKGIDILLSAFSKVLKEIPTAHLILAGEGDRISFYKSLSMNLGIAPNVTFAGSVSQNELVKLYQNTDTVVLPSTTIQEGFGMTLIEGNACGKPVIGSAIGGMKYVIRDGVDGFSVQPRDEDALANAIVKILSNEETAKAMGIHGRRKAEQYDWGIVADKTEAVFQSVVKSQAGGTY